MLKLKDIILYQKISSICLRSQLVSANSQRFVEERARINVKQIGITLAGVNLWNDFKRKDETGQIPPRV